MKNLKNVEENAHVCPKQTGITLLALVVTIVILLILAGVSLNFVAGNNGILQRATTAVKTANEKAIEEKLQTVMLEIQMDYYAGGMEETTFADYLKTHDVYNLPSGEMFSFEVNEDNTVRIEYYSKEENDVPDMEFSFDLMTNEIAIEASGGEIKPGRTKSMVTYDTNGGTGIVPASRKVLQGTNVKVDTTTTLTKYGYNFLGWALSDSATTVITNFEMPANNVTLYAVWQEWPLATSVISGTNYGDSVNYSANGITNWKIFSKDGAHIYLITENHAIGSTLSLGTGIYVDENNHVGVSDGSPNTLVSWMTNSSYWSNFVNTSYANQATGGPTLEQLTISANGKLGTSYDSTSIHGKFLNSLLYGTGNFWMASFYGDTDIVGVVWYQIGGGQVDGTLVSKNNSCGVRPLVQLKSTVKAKWNGTAWDLNN